MPPKDKRRHRSPKRAPRPHAKPGRSFEEAVFAFVRTLDPSAKPIFDHKVIDRHTGQLRQCDVWIDATFGGHLPDSILVSCKDDAKSRRPLGVGDIEKFAGEIVSTSATMGVIYSNVGFAQTAVQKAKALGIYCCRLYQNQPADIPQAILVEHIHLRPSFFLTVHSSVPVPTPISWQEIFDMVVDASTGDTVLDRLAALYATGEVQAIDDWRGRPELQRIALPYEWELTIRDAEDGRNVLVLSITMRVWWRAFRAPAKATTLTGSYSYANESFLGSLSGPAIDTWNADPGESWIPISDEDIKNLAGRNFLATAMVQPDIRTGLREGMKGKVAVLATTLVP